MTQTAIQAAYKSLIQRGRLTADPFQTALVDRLGLLQTQLLNPQNAIPIPGQRRQVPQGLYIYGSVGTGKSRVADLFAATLPSAISKRRSHFYEFMMDIHSRLHQARSKSDYSGDPLVKIGREICAESRILCFDEFQVTDIADAMILSRLFGSIWQAGGVMVSTSNRHPDNLYENGLNRDLFIPFIRQIKQRCEVWEIGGKEDYRMQAHGNGNVVGGREETFLKDPEQFQSKLAKAMGSGILQHVSIPVYGSRKLHVNAVPKTQIAISSGKRFSAVSGTFEELCEASLGSADYYSLCSSSENIFISGLRHFRAGEKDSVRRFISMFDMARE